MFISKIELGNGNVAVCFFIRKAKKVHFYLQTKKLVVPLCVN